MHTLGVLLESHGGGYKDAVRSSNPLGLASAVFRNAVGGGNPLMKGEGEYERINRDSGGPHHPLLPVFKLTRYT